MLRNPYEVYGSVPEFRLQPTEEEVYCSLNYFDHQQPLSPGGRRLSASADYVPASLLSSISAAGMPNRQYIDPWDLENYAYLQR